MTPEPVKIGEPRPSKPGVVAYAVACPFQSHATQIEVLLPERLDTPARRRVVYCLPVEAGIGGQFGDALLEVKTLDLHNRFGLIFVAPGFSQTPWYADHPENPRLRQESYLLKVVLPLIESRYPVIQETAGRLLLGFSKSGWGAFSLLLRHPERFGRAAAWDAPLQKARPDVWGMDTVFATQANFEPYRISELLKRQAPKLRGAPPRLALLGYGNFQDHVAETHTAMEALGIPHWYSNHTARAHTWGGGWLAEAVEFLARP